MKDIKMLDVNLQLFAGDEDFDGDDSLDYDDDFDDIDDADDDEPEGDDSDDEKNDGQEDDPDGEDDSDKDADDADTTKQKPKQKDKITQALIKQKQLNKHLKSKLDEIEQKDREQEQKNRRKALVDKYVEKGYDDEDAEAEADKQLENEAIRNTVKKLEFVTEHADVLAKYPQARKNVDKLLKLQKATGWSVEKICRVEYETKESAFDSKVKNDQEARLKQKKRLSTPAGGQTPIQSVKLDYEDERAYQFYAKKNPGVSRKQYTERLSQAASQKIPHDSWD